MPKATVRLASGAEVHIEGSIAEVKDLLAFYGKPSIQSQARSIKPSPKHAAPRIPAITESEEISIADIVNNIKDCDEADEIETRILDTTSQVNRILLPLFVAQKYKGIKRGLTTGEISAVTRDLGIPIHIANVSNALKGTASRYVMGDKVRKRGQPVRYVLSRRGMKYVENVIMGKSDGE